MTSVSPTKQNPCSSIGVAIELLGIALDFSHTLSWVGDILIGFGAGLVFWPFVASFFEVQDD